VKCAPEEQQRHEPVRAGADWLKSSFAEKDLEFLINTKLAKKPAMCPYSKVGQHHPELH